jgi:hypothetical protein
VLLRSATLLALAACSTAAAWAQSPSEPRYIFQCTNAQGRKLTSDRMIAECNDREQLVFSSGGSLVRVVPPSLTAEERVVVDAKRERERALREAQADNQRRDRQLMLRFANEKSHQRAREQALEPVETATRTIHKRLELLAEDRVPLDREAEFYVGKPLPVKLKRQYDTIEATEAGLQTALEAQADEVARINELYDIELERLKKLWAGATPGTLGPMRAPAATTAKSAPKTSSKPAEATPRPGNADAKPLEHAQEPRNGNRARSGGGSGGAGLDDLKTVSRSLNGPEAPR